MKPVSLKARLRWLIVIVLIAVLLPLGVFSYRRTIGEVDELLDGRLAESARTLQLIVRQAGIHTLSDKSRQELLVPVPGTTALKLPGQEHTHESEVGFQVSDRQGYVLLASANIANLKPPVPDTTEFNDISFGGYRWRVYTLPDAADGLVIRTAERYDSRRDILHALWVNHGVPLLIGLPLLALLVGWAVRRGLRPLAVLAQALATHEPGSRQPIRIDPVPQELRPVLDALNAQLARQEDTLERERRFSADVAHELRTPLASIMINLESAMATANPAEAHDSLAGGLHSVAVLARRVEQLLALARLEAGAVSTQRRAVNLIEVAGAVIEELTMLISGSGVLLDFVHVDAKVVVQGYEVALTALMRNLIENALRHIPRGGQIQLVVEQGLGEATIDVIDDGPGIPLERRDAVFARFHREASSRGEGYGLGLSIVQRAAELHHATINLLDSPFGRGLRVHVTFPLPPSSEVSG